MSPGGVTEEAKELGQAEAGLSDRSDLALPAVVEPLERPVGAALSLRRVRSGRDMDGVERDLGVGRRVDDEERRLARWVE